MNKFFKLLILGLLSVTPNAPAMFLSKVAVVHAARGNMRKNYISVHAPCARSYSTERDCKSSLPLAKAIHEKNYEKMLGLLLSYSEYKKSTCYRNNNCCMKQQLNDLEDELQKYLLIVQGVKISQKRLQLHDEFQEMSRKRYEEKYPESRLPSDFYSDINRR